MTTASLSPQIIIHLTFASGALLLGPFALASRKGTRRHRGLAMPGSR